MYHLNTSGERLVDVDDLGNLVNVRMSSDEQVKHDVQLRERSRRHGVHWGLSIDDKLTTSTVSQDTYLVPLVHQDLQTTPNKTIFDWHPWTCQNYWVDKPKYLGQKMVKVINAWVFLSYWGARARASPPSLRLCRLTRSLIEYSTRDPVPYLHV